MPSIALAQRRRTHICDFLNRRLPSARLWGNPSCRLSPMTEGKVLAIILACYGAVLLAIVWQAML